VKPDHIGGYLKPSRRCPGWPGGLRRWHV